MPRYIDMGDRIELAKGAMEFAHLYGFKPVQLYNAMLAAVAEEPEGAKRED
ncbi:MAG: hypothetical protein ABSF90_03605 [Syntrophobacteraceae bacterium]|jgi:mannose-6-phosphate isomerase class I